MYARKRLKKTKKSVNLQIQPTFLIFNHFFSMENIFLGKWEGFLKQKGGVKDVYKFMLLINTANESGIDGFSKIWIPENGAHGKIKLTGTFYKNSLKCEELFVLSEDTTALNGGYWCIKSYHLMLEEDEEKYMLRGNWEGCNMAFPENRIYLQKDKI